MAGTADLRKSPTRRDGETSPLLSVVTISYNNFDGLCSTLASLLRQDFCDYEIILIDGQSTDGTRFLLDGFRHRAAHVVSEPDAGPYDAMNKGLEAAKGEWIVFMNSGDCFYGQEALSSAFDRDLSGIDLMFGRTMNRETRKEMPYKPIDQIHTGNAFCHQSAIYRRAVHARFPYDTSLRISADYKATLGMLKAGSRIGRLDRVVSVVDAAGISSDVSARIAERDRVIQQVVGGQPLALDLVDLP